MDETTVLIVDDEADILELYEAYLVDASEIKTATNGTDALDLIDESVDVALLDRRMPEMTGDEVLKKFRKRGYTCPVIMVTAVSPDHDITALPFNEYITKPVSRTELTAAVDRVTNLSDREVKVQEFFSLMDKKLALEHELDVDEFRSSEEYEDLRSRMDSIKEDVSPPITPIEENIAKRLAQKWPDAPPQDRQAVFPDD